MFEWIRKLIPSKRPKVDENLIRAIIEEKVIDSQVGAVTLVGIRGYFSKANERAIYDDCLVWVTPEGCKAFNANTDPGRFRKDIATLRCGVWKYKKGMHPAEAPNYPAFRQAASVVVDRDDGKKGDIGWFGINIHKGGKNTVSSLGCQTIPPEQWDEFKKHGYQMLTNYRQDTFNYVLVEKDFMYAIEK